MARGEAPAFQFYPKDYLCSDSVLELGLAAQGAYVRMLCKCWLSGSIPADANKVARLIGFPGQKKAVEEALELFYTDPENSNRVRHKRLDEERAHQQKNSEKRRQAARSRWDTVKGRKDERQQELPVSQEPPPPECKADANASPVHASCCAEKEQMECPPSSTPTPTTTAENREREKGRRGAPSEQECQSYARSCAPPGREDYAESIGREFHAIYAGQDWRKQTGEDILSNKKWKYVLKVRLEAEMRKENERGKRYSNSQRDGRGRDGRGIRPDSAGPGEGRTAAGAGIQVRQL